MTSSLMTCPSCGTDVSEGTKFCPNCGTKLDAATAREVRKTVTVLFSDISGSTALGELLDPESLRGLLSRYFVEMQHIIERHGGTVEKFIGDAVMAVFGIPTLHEDDALRAVRAASDIRDRLATLNAELERERGIAIIFRTGVHTGEVVAGEISAGQSLVTGDTVNTAARLEQAAPPGEILLGDPTYRLTRDAITVEPMDPISAKGKSQPVPAFRLLSVVPGREGHRRRMDSPLAGRADELAQLQDRFDRVAADRTPQLVTVLGPAGIGKSRLVSELLASVSDQATVLKGRCLPYGDGITYWPLREIVHAAAGIGEGDSAEEAKGKLAGLLEEEPEAELQARLVGTALGLEREGAPQEEIFWATRRLLERLARERPLVTVWEDIHWAEQTLLDLLEYVLDLAADSPILLVCPARAELVEEVRPGWGGNRPNSTTLRLEALPDNATSALLDNLPGGPALPGGLRTRILSAAEGNPLYLEEMLGMLVDEGHLVRSNGEWVARDGLEKVEIPLSVRALLATRIDALPATERTIAKRASVAGRVFEAAALREMTPESAADVGPSLLGLVRKELVRPQRSELTAGDAFKFRHLLIRDAAYEALAKSERADLHERFASWLEGVSGDRLEEYQEIVGYHLEQAHGYRLELGSVGAESKDLAQRAATALLAAGRHAAARDDPGAAGLLKRAGVLAEDGSLLEARIEIDLARVPATNTQDRLDMLAHARASAEAAGDVATALRAQVEEIWVLAWIDPEGVGARLTKLGPIADRLRALGDDAGLTTALRIMAEEQGGTGQTAQALTTMTEAIDAAMRAGDVIAEEKAIERRLVYLMQGAATAEEGLAAALDVLARPRLARSLRAFALLLSGVTLAMRERRTDAYRSVEEAHRIIGELGVPWSGQDQGWAMLLLGDYTRAESFLRTGMEAMLAKGSRGLASTSAALLSEALLNLERYEEAEAVARRAEELTSADDLSAVVPAKCVQARCLAQRGDFGGALSLVGEAVEMADGSDWLEFQGETRLHQARILVSAGRPVDAADSARVAVDRFERKGNLTYAAQARSLLQQTSESRG